jgi:predicted SnoaL-like aldol condensation-catalyzing enzyme
MNTASNRNLVVDALTAVMIRKDPSAVARYWSPDYIQHSPIQASGLAPVLLLADSISTNAEFKYEIARVLADGDLVAVQGKATGWMPDPVVLWNVFRVQDGALAEHWEGIQSFAKPNPSGRTMLDGASAISDVEKTAANRETVAGFLQTVLIDGELGKVTRYISQETYLQHNPLVADGLEGFGAAVAEMARHGVFMKYAKVHRIVAEGNFVLSHSEGEFASKPTQFFDLFRVLDGLIVEHWDVIQDISAPSLNQNGVFQQLTK